MLYNTFAINTIASNNTDNEYNIVLEDNNTITIPSNSNKTIYFHIKNTNKGTIKYGVGYNTTATIEVKVYNDSIDKVSDTIDYGENKFIKLYLNNPTNTSSTVTLTSVLGYEYGGDLIVPSGISLITEVYTPPTNLAKYITNLYTKSSKETVVNNEITYNVAPSVSLMNDRLGGTTTSLDGGNIRYYGASPNNYIYFNCSDYNNQSSETCELWRIIGVFDGKVKIMRNETIGKYSWDTSSSSVNSGYGVNEWSQADLMKLFNPNHESESVGGSLYYNSSSGTCYSGLKNATTSCDFTTTGIKNDATRNMIARVKRNTGVYNATSIYSNVMYEKERGTNVISSSSDGITRTTSWTGKIALPYPSDYGYATDLSKCSETLINYNKSTDSYACRINDWMYSIITDGGANDGWLLTPNSSTASSAFLVFSSGYVTYLSGVFSAYVVTTPTLYLKANQDITLGDGSQSNPFHLTEGNTDNTSLANHITKLYTNAEKSTVENNKITYNVASSESLMNDRLGGTTTSLDGGNIRYYGASPNNYIYFNCSDYNNQSSETCELWRIIGVFDGKVKIMRNESIGEYSWDTSASSVSSGQGVNEWSQADLMKLLNPGHDSESVGGSLYYNNKSGTCYNGQSNVTTPCDFTTTGIKNDTTRNMIADVTWKLGGWNNSDIYSNQIYGYERGTTVISNPSDGIKRKTTWTGKVALPYPSDYGYATDLSKCSLTLLNYNSADDSYVCRENDWMFSIFENHLNYLLTPDTAYGPGTFSVYSDGSVNYYGFIAYAYGANDINPTLYLSSEQTISSGDGSESNPYKLSVN